MGSKSVHNPVEKFRNTQIHLGLLCEVGGVPTSDGWACKTPATLLAPAQWCLSEAAGGALRAASLGTLPVRTRGHVGCGPKGGEGRVQLLGHFWC